MTSKLTPMTQIISPSAQKRRGIFWTLIFDEKLTKAKKELNRKNKFAFKLCLNVLRLLVCLIFSGVLHHTRAFFVERTFKTLETFFRPNIIFQNCFEKFIQIIRTLIINVLKNNCNDWTFHSWVISSACRTCTCQWVRKVSFSENFAYVTS